MDKFKGCNDADKKGKKRKDRKDKSFHKSPVKSVEEYNKEDNVYYHMG